MTPPARLIDITRLSSRIGRVFTGVDRVELAYLRAVHADPIPAFAVSRTAIGFVLLDDAGIARLLERIDARDWPRPDFVSRVNHRLTASAKIGQTLVRSLSTKRCLPTMLKSMLQAELPEGFAYLNVGHSSLTERTLAAVKGISGTTTAILVHDTIPLDFPDFQRPGTVEKFRAKLARVATFADLVICVSESGQRDVTRHLFALGATPKTVAVYLGVQRVDTDAVPAKIPNDRPYFVTVGTIEPRKNHALLLDVWGTLGDSAPQLFICGSRGWANEDVLARLDHGVPNVTVIEDLSDGVLASLVKEAQGLLFPTFAEGFGLPPLEALALGTPVICSDLPVLRETLGSNAIYVDPTDVYQWKKEVLQLAEADRSQVGDQFTPPDWAAHFKIVFTMT